MRYIEAPNFGGPEVLKLIDANTPGPGERMLVVEVQASGVNLPMCWPAPDSIQHALFLSRGPRNGWIFWRPTRLSAVRRSEGANKNGLISPCRKLVAVVTSHHSGTEKWQAQSFLILVD